MELVRQKNIATIITFPLVDADGDAVTSAGALDSNIDAWADGSVPDGFVACTNEATEIGATGVYYLSLTQAEMNVDYVYITIASTSAKKQHILIRTMVGDPLNLSVHNAAAIWSAGSRALTTPNDYKATGFSVHSAADVWTTGSRELSTPANYKATGFSTHNAAAIWSEVTKEITGGALTTPADYKATGFSTHNASNVWSVVTRQLSGTISDFDALDTALDSAHGAGSWEGGGSAPTVGEIADAVWNEPIVDHTNAAQFGGKNQKVVPSETLADYKATGFSIHNAAAIWSAGSRELSTPANYKATGFSTHSAAAVWSEVTKVITGGVLTTPADYKADVSALATATNLQTVDDNVDAVLIDTGTTIPAELLRLRGLNGEFIVAEYTFVGNDNTAIEYWQYDTEANFNTHDKTTGLIGSWILNNTFVSNNPTVAKSKRLS